MKRARDLWFLNSAQRLQAPLSPGRPPIGPLSCWRGRGGAHWRPGLHQDRNENGNADSGFPMFRCFQRRAGRLDWNQPCQLPSGITSACGRQPASYGSSVGHLWHVKAGLVAESVVESESDTVATGAPKMKSGSTWRLVSKSNTSGTRTGHAHQRGADRGTWNVGITSLVSCRRHSVGSWRGLG